MGKRKERRLAAKGASNRRVKLDLFAEPSGEKAGTSGLDEIGGDIDKDHRAVAPTSPSSSGEKQENPLLLLGQYSDDEIEEEDVDEEISKRPKIDADGSPEPLADGEIAEPTEVGKISRNNSEEDIDNGKQQPDQVDSGELVDGYDGKENETIYEASDHCVNTLNAQVSTPETSGGQVDVDQTGVWKLVMHEDSNQYYYWNTVTGETSWEVPTDLVEGQTVGAGLHSQLNTESTSCAYASVAHELASNSLISKDEGECGSALEIENENREAAHVSCDPHQCLAAYAAPGAPLLNEPPGLDPSLLSNDVSMAQLTCPEVDGHMPNDEEKDKHLRQLNECYAPDPHSARLVNFCGSLLQRLEALNRSENRPEGHELIMKEIEIRLSDCNALTSYGSSLLPFWMHTESQLKQLESTISKGEASLLASAKSDSKLGDVLDSLSSDTYCLQSIQAGYEVVASEMDISSTAKSTSHAPSTGPSNVQIEPTDQMPEVELTQSRSSSVSPGHRVGSEQELKIAQEANPDAASTHLVAEDMPHVDDDIDMDMDVEMEVDDETPSGLITATNMPLTKCPSPLEQVQSNQLLAEFPPVPPDEPSVPPPPDEEWIPPPPPDSEPVPPPPPEEPPLPSSPPPYSDTVPLYPDQYNTGYSVTGYQYYAPPVGEVSSASYYANAEGVHVLGPQPLPYYDPVVTGALPEVSVDVNAVTPAAYYDISNGTLPAQSNYYIESGPFSYHSTVPISDHTGSVGIDSESTYSLLPEVIPEHEVPTDVIQSQASTLQAGSVASSTQPVGKALLNGTAGDALQVASSSKDQTKVRRKKHTVAVAPSLRSNKKVSSLVDKWKAAKEELHSEDDEEPDNAYDILEKKRQKEIEKWRSRQIASGEAQDNANFLPLGGDWREKVRRKKAKAKKTESVQESTEASVRKQPDLTELSKNLPSGWQVYWDESSKEVYYGNSITSETTWTRPTR